MPVIFVMFVRPSLRIYRRSQWMDFREVLYWELLRKSVEKSQIVVEMGQKYWALYVKTWVCFIRLAATYAAQRYRERIVCFHGTAFSV